VPKVHPEQRDRRLENPLGPAQDGSVTAEDDHELDPVVGPDRLVQRDNGSSEPRLDG
jgi:hypothetical protein